MRLLGLKLSLKVVNKYQLLHSQSNGACVSAKGKMLLLDKNFFFQKWKILSQEICDITSFERPEDSKVIMA